jgi:hypothetical protein
MKILNERKTTFSFNINLVFSIVELAPFIAVFIEQLNHLSNESWVWVAKLGAPVGQFRNKSRLLSFSFKW